MTSSWRSVAAHITLLERLLILADHELCSDLGCVVMLERRQRIADLRKSIAKAVWQTDWAAQAIEAGTAKTGTGLVQSTKARSEGCAKGERA